MENLAENLNFPENKEFGPSSQSILVIDDSADTLQLQKILLGLAGYEVFTAESGSRAIQILSEIDEPDLIILDMQLGDMSGSEFLVMLEEKRPDIIKHVPIIFMTGMDEVPKSKAIGFIRKPAPTKKLLQVVSHFIEAGRHAPYKH